MPFLRKNGSGRLPTVKRQPGGCDLGRWHSIRLPERPSLIPWRGVFPDTPTPYAKGGISGRVVRGAVDAKRPAATASRRAVRGRRWRSDALSTVLVHQVHQLVVHRLGVAVARLDR